MDSISLLAYLDPGTGSMLLQAIVGGGAGLIVLVRHLFRSWRLRNVVDSDASNCE